MQFMRIENGGKLRIEEDTKPLNRPRITDGCIFSVTDIPETLTVIDSAVNLMLLFKNQSDIERLKDPAIVNAIFPQNPARIEALGLMALIAPFIWG